MRTAPIYTTYSNWSRVIVLGIIPFVALVYLNFKIYQVCYFWFRDFSFEIDYYAKQLAIHQDLIVKEALFQEIRE